MDVEKDKIELESHQVPKECNEVDSQAYKRVKLIGGIACANRPTIAVKPPEYSASHSEATPRRGRRKPRSTRSHSRQEKFLNSNRNWKELIQPCPDLTTREWPADATSPDPPVSMESFQKTFLEILLRKLSE